MLSAADNIHGLNPIVAEALQRLDPHPIRDLIRRCEQNGAQLLDLNPGRLSRHNEDRIEFLVETAQEATRLPLMLDSPDPRILARGLRVCKEKPILNALSLEEQKLEEILPLAVEHQTPVVLLLLDARSFPPAFTDEKLAIAIELRERALSAGLNHDDLIFDPVLPNLSWDDAWVRIGEDIKTIRFLSGGAVFQEPCRTMAGLSNLRSGVQSRYSWNLEEAVMYLLAGAGLSILLANVLRQELRSAYQLVDLVT